MTKKEKRKGNRTDNRGHGPPKIYPCKVEVHCTEESRDRWQAQADREGLTRAEWIRRELDDCA